MITAEWLDTIMARLSAAYPGRFPPRAWPLSLLRAEWGRELDGATDAQLRHALANLPTDHPPNALQFRALAMTVPQAPPEAPERQPRKVKPNAELLSTAKTFAEGIKQARSPTDPLRWARMLRTREERGERLNRVQQAAWRDALRYDLIGEAVQEFERERADEHDGQDN